MTKLTFLNDRDNLLQLFEHDPVVQKSIADWRLAKNNPCDTVEFDTPDWDYFYNCSKILYSRSKELYGFISTSAGFYDIVLKLLISFYSALNGTGVKFEFNSKQELRKAMYNLFTNICSIMCLTKQIGNKLSASQAQGKYLHVVNEHSGTKEDCRLVGHILKDYSQELVAKVSYDPTTAKTQDWLCYEFDVYSKVSDKKLGGLLIKYDFVSSLSDIAAALLNDLSFQEFRSKVLIKGIIIFYSTDPNNRWSCNTSFGPIKVDEMNIQKDVNRLVIK